MAILQNPGITMSELALTTGVSKASLYRIYSTKDNLLKIIIDKVTAVFEDIHKITSKNENEFMDSLKSLVSYHCNNCTNVLYLGRDDFFEMFGSEKFDAYYDELEKFFQGRTENRMYKT